MVEFRIGGYHGLNDHSGKSFVKIIAAVGTTIFHPTHDDRDIWVVEITMFDVQKLWQSISPLPWLYRGSRGGSTCCSPRTGTTPLW
jgi:hypothetical protein